MVHITASLPQRALDKENETHLKRMPLRGEVFYLQLIMVPTRAPRLPSATADRSPAAITANYRATNYDLCQRLVLYSLGRKKHTDRQSDRVAT